MDSAFRSRNWCWTWCNYDEEIMDINMIFGLFGGEDKLKYVCFGKEVAPTTGTRHLQGYVDFKNARTLNGLKRIHKEIHWEPRMGTWKQAVDYCKKDRDFHEWGTPHHQGERTDIKSITASVKEGLNNIELLNTYEDKALRIMNHVERARNIYTEVKRDWEMDVRIYVGAPGAGKTRAVWDEFGVENVYAKMNGKWWDGYKGELCVLIDDFDPDTAFDTTYCYYLKLLDRYPMRVEYKGGSREFSSHVIIFTSNFHPDDWWPRRHNKGAFMRRISEIRVFDKPAQTHKSAGESCVQPINVNLLYDRDALTTPPIGTDAYWANK